MLIECPVQEFSDSSRWAAAVITLGVAIFAYCFFRHAHSQGWRWVSTLMTGFFFGWLAEATILNGRHGPIWYEYCGNPLYLRVLGVPVVVAVGWGCILYASTWTSQRLLIAEWMRPIAAGLLAINIDLSLDPVATKLAFWSWFRLGPKGEMLPFTSSAMTGTHPADYYGVPYDNFLGWFLIVGIYALTVRYLFSKYDEYRHGMKWQRPKEWGQGPGRYGSKADLADVIIPPIAAAISVTFLWIIRTLSASVYAKVDAAIIFVIGLPILSVVSWLLATRSNRHHPVSWPIILLPVFFNLFALVVLVTRLIQGEMAFDTLMVAITFHAITGFLAFAWPSLARLFPSDPKDARVRGASQRPPRKSAEHATSAALGGGAPTATVDDAAE